MNTQEVQRLFYVPHDQWKLHHDEARKLRGVVTQDGADCRFERA